MGGSKQDIKDIKISPSLAGDTLCKELHWKLMCLLYPMNFLGELCIVQ